MLAAHYQLFANFWAIGRRKITSTLEAFEERKHPPRQAIYVLPGSKKTATPLVDFYFLQYL